MYQNTYPLIEPDSTFQGCSSVDRTEVKQARKHRAKQQINNELNHEKECVLSNILI